MRGMLRWVWIAVFVALSASGCSHSSKPEPAIPETTTARDSHVPSDPELVRERAKDAEKQEDQARDDDEGGFEQRGKASYYGSKFEGRKTASGDRYRGDEMTAAHRTLPFGTRVRVTNLTNGKSVEVVINDRGPFAKGRIVDLSRKAAKEIDMLSAGVVQVKLEVLALADDD